MFTGLIKKVGEIQKIKVIEDTKVLRAKILFDQDVFDVDVGDSLAVNGVCLTAIKVSKNSVTVEISPETLSRTSLGDFQKGQIVNLEPALRLKDRIGGHFVLGHVDAVGSVERLQKLGKFYKLQISYPKEFAALIIDKGSVAIDGVSLTVNQCNSNSFEVMIIPHTWSETILSRYHKGLKVNLEFDILGKYILRSEEIKKEASHEKRQRA